MTNTDETSEIARSTSKLTGAPVRAIRRVGGWAMRRVTSLIMVFAVLVGVLAVGVGWLAWTRHEQSAIADARTAAVDAAREGLVAALSYDYRTVDKSAKQASAALTGEFREQYSELMKKVVIPSAEKQKLVTKASVSGASVVSATASDVDVLALLDQTTGGKGDAPPRLGGSRVLLHLEHVDGQWLISSMKPV